jgi:hypothetical protein
MIQLHNSGENDLVWGVVIIVITVTLTLGAIWLLGG